MANVHSAFTGAAEDRNGFDGVRAVMRNNDLDDRLAERGYRTSRIDIDYSHGKTPPEGTDPTPFRFSPNEGGGRFSIDRSIPATGFKESAEI